MIIGLTGGLATGKTTIAQLLKADGYTIIDADLITHQLYESNTDVLAIITRLFPNAVVRNTVNRLILAKEVTKNPGQLPQLEVEMHPIIINEIKLQLFDSISDNLPVILMAPLLFETGLEHLCDYVVCLYADLSSQRERAMERLHMTEEKFNALIKRQWTNDARHSKSDLWVSSDMPVRKTYQIINDFIQKHQAESNVFSAPTL